MKKIKKLNTALLTVLSLIIISGVMFSTTSFASSLNSISTTNNKTITSEIPKSVLKQARISAEALVLGKTDVQMQVILHSHDLKEIVTQEKISPKDFREEVQADMTTYLSNQGYSQAQITAAIDSKYMRQHRYHI